MADALGSLGYPGLMNLFSEMEAEFNHDPAVVLTAALSCDNLDERVIEALPWLVLRFPNLDWPWVLRESRSRNTQNRLGFVVTAALRVGASCYGNEELLMKLSSIEESLFEIRLEKEDTFCRRLASGERDWLREARPPEARQWNLLTDLNPNDLAYDGIL